MGDYVRDLTSEFPVFRKEAERIAESLRTKATISAGVIRWNSNGRVPPEDCVALAAHIGLPVNVAACNAARSAELDAFLADYRKNHKGPSEEERFEARAAFGPGKELVNVFTGHKWRT